MLYNAYLSTYFDENTYVHSYKQNLLMAARNTVVAAILCNQSHVKILHAIVIENL